jgi:hypothetical protein
MAIRRSFGATPCHIEGKLIDTCFFTGLAVSAEIDSEAQKESAASAPAIAFFKDGLFISGYS